MKASPQATDTQAVQGKRRFPRRLASHLLREFAFPLFGSLAAFIAISLLLAVFDDLPDFNGVDIPGGMTALYFLARTPDYLMTVFPISALLAVSFMTIVLGKNNELTALRSAGLSLLTTAAPVWLTALLLCFGSLLINEFVRPVCKRYVEMVQTDYLDNPARKTAKGGRAPLRKHTPKETNQVAYFNPLKGQEWFFADFRPYEENTGVSVCLQDAHGRVTSVLTAATAEYDRDEGAWRFRDCSLTEYDYSQGGLPVSKPPVYLPEVPAPGDEAPTIYRENPRDIAIQSQPVEEMTMKDLLRMNRRKILLDASDNSQIRTLLAYRCLSPLATLIAVLLGFALTIPQGRTSAIRGFVCAVGLFVAYTLLSQFFLVLGKNGHLWWPLAGGLPTIAALALGLYLAYKRQ